MTVHSTWRIWSENAGCTLIEGNGRSLLSSSGTLILGDGDSPINRSTMKTRAGVSLYVDREQRLGCRNRTRERRARTNERNVREERADDPRRLVSYSLWYCYTFCSRQLSRTKWPFAVSSLARGPGDGARVRSSLAQADDENAILRSGRWPLGTFSVSPHFSARYVFQSLFEIFAHVYTRQITRAENGFHALSLRWRGNAICLSTDDGSVRDTLPRSTLRFDSCSINR